jgi:peptidoglycan/LPS O-acetylase OafA/YrhL
VFLSHVGGFFIGTPLEGTVGALGRPGATGVTFFFILSGFVLAWSHDPERRFADFYRRRLARVGPAYWTAFLLVLPVFLILDLGLTWADLFSATLLQSWVPDPDVYYGGVSVAWSLSNEAFFYLLFPFLIGPLVAMRDRSLLVLLAGLVAAAIVIPIALHPAEANQGTSFWAAYIFPPTRLVEFALGMGMAAFLRRGVRLRIPPAAAYAAALVAYLAAGQGPLHLMWVAVPIIPFAILIYSVAEADLADRTTGLRHPALIRLGHWSYAFYLLHTLVILVAVELGLAPAEPALGPSLVLVGGCYLLAAGLSALMYTRVEQPLEARIRRGRSRPAVV